MSCRPPCRGNQLLKRPFSTNQHVCRGDCVLVAAEHITLSQNPTQCRREDVKCCNVVVRGHQRDQIYGGNTGRRIRPEPVNKSKANLNGSPAQRHGIIPGVIPPSWPPTMRPEKRVAHLGGERGVSGEVRWPDQSLTRSPCQRMH